ncbi:MAG: hypothetical protein RIR00_2092 [Pseudomonadota bacterium]
MPLDMDDALQTFIIESRELLQQMEEALLQIELQPGNPELINAIFRAAHTIKGSAGLFGLDPIVAFTHVAESVLDRVRSHELALDGPLTALFLAVGDQLGGMIDRLARKVATDPEQEAAIAALVSRLEACLKGKRSEAASHPAPADTAAVPANSATSSPANTAPTLAVPPVPASAATRSAAHWHIALEFGPDVLRHGMDPISILRYLGTLGDIRTLIPHTDRVPALAALDAENCYLGFDLALESQADAALIDGAFDFIREDCRIGLLPPGADLAGCRAYVASQDDPAASLDLLLECGSLDPDTAVSLALPCALAEVEPAAAAETGAVLPTSSDITPPAPQPATPPASASRSASAEARPDSPRADNSEARLIRVDADKLDQLINLVGELIIAGAGANMVARAQHVPELIEATALLSRLVEDVRDSALNLRMVQIGATFNRFRRVVRDVSRELGKDIELEIHGGETELDKSVVEKIGDPLTHIVRNAMDHGIEAAEVRQAQGKPARGRLRLNAFHDSGSIVIEVSDDGRGLDKARILQKAVERGMVEAGASLSDSEIFSLVFEPGFSTAEQISKLSGRGVGMDVVKSNIEALRGSVELASTPGAGTTVRIRLPLTLAIIDGFMVGVAGAAYVVPLDMVVECIELPTALASGSGSPDYLNLRGNLLPFIRLRDLFEIAGPPPPRENVVVVQYAGQRAGLVVDRLQGELQTVIKPLGKVFSRIRGIGGSTILGNGEVALILDIPGLVGQLARLRRTLSSPATLAAAHGQ